jgi:predicted nucleic acid-binding protein
MRVVFVDTSAFYAVLDRDDANHHCAAGIWRQLIAEEAKLVTSNYILVETAALIEHRLGLEAVRAFEDRVRPILDVEWLDESVHRRAVDAVLTAARRRVSLVDTTSFLVMRDCRIRSAFCFDSHFAEQGFAMEPSDAVATP